MGIEIDLLRNYPITKRDLSGRLEAKSIETREIARKFGKDYFDGDRNYGYGGFTYNEKYWKNVIPDFVSRYKLDSSSKVLDVGCGKGFFIYDLIKAIPGIYCRGIDISSYAIENSMTEVKNNLLLGNAKSLPFEDNTFDLVISINTVHNLVRPECGISLSEIERVSKGKSFITVDAFRNEEEKERMEAWNLTALTMMSCSEWENFFREFGFNGDYYWFIP